MGRHVFYNGSFFDAIDVGANASDDGAIAPDKTALLPGGTATFANYTSYSRGINGIMVDIANLPGTPTAGDFEFRTGNNNTPGSWSLLATAPDISVRPGAGVNGSDRVTLIWPSFTLMKTWIEVKVKATTLTGLTTPDVFYFGNTAGEVGNSAIAARVTSTDEIFARNSPKTIANPATILDRHDFDRDTRVSATDQIIARNSRTTFLNTLNLINPGSGQGLMGGGGEESFDGGGESLLLDDAPVIVVGNHTLLPNTAGQTIQIYVTGGQMVPGIDVDMQIGDGGPELTQLGLAAGIDGPAITNINTTTGTIFAGTSNAVLFSPVLPQLASNYLAIVSSGVNVEADGLLLTLTVDTTGFTSGTWDLLLSGVLDYSGFGPFASNFAGMAIDITNGTITIDDGEGLMGGGGGEMLSTGLDGETAIPAITHAAERVNQGLQRGVRFDIGRLGNAAGLDAEDFVLRVIDIDDPTNVITLDGSYISSLSVASGTGLEGSDQLTLILGEALANYDALEITLKAGADTGLASDDVFDFAIGEIFG